MYVTKEEFDELAQCYIGAYAALQVVSSAILTVSSGTREELKAFIDEKLVQTNWPRKENEESTQ